MVFGSQALKDQNFCLQEERDYFQTKYLEQVSEIQALKDELSKSKKEVARLRQELMDVATSKTTTTTPDTRLPQPYALERTSSTFEDEEDDDSEKQKDRGNDTEEDDDRPTPSTLYEEDVELRASAEKLLQWASYRQSYSRQSSTSAGSSRALSPTPLPLLDDEKKDGDETDVDDLPPPQDNDLISDLSEEYDDDEEDCGSAANQKDEPEPSTPSSASGQLLDRFERAVTNL